MARAVASLVQVVASAAVLAFAAPGQADAAEISGTVFVDRNGDGLLSAGDLPAPGVWVWLDSRAAAQTDGFGRYHLESDAGGIVWASAPDGHEPAPSWQSVGGAGATTVDLPLRTASASGPVRFVHGSDIHLGSIDEAEARTATQLATAIAPMPHFLVITGDLTSNTKEAEMAQLAGALTGLGVPFVPVAGNHDWHDGGPVYRKTYGPPMYSFTSGGVHFVVLNFNAADAEQIDFLNADLEHVAPSLPVVVLTHAPPDDDLAAQLADAGVDYLFTGHLHSNRVIRRGDMLELNVEAMAMGGNDYTPAGYHVVTATDAGLVIEHRSTVSKPVVEVTSPRPGDCVPLGRATLIAAVDVGAGTPRVTVSIDGGPARSLAPVGGWTWTVELDDVPTGAHELSLQVTPGSATPRPITRQQPFCIIGDDEQRAPSGTWSQLGGGPGHTGQQGERLAPPLRTVWAETVGGHVEGGAPVVSAGVIVVPVTDYADGRGGGVVAFRAQDGVRLWEARVGVSVRGAPAIAGDTAVFLADDGVLWGHALASGERRFRTDLATGLDRAVAWSVSSLAVSGGLVFASLQQRLAAVDAASGAVRWMAQGASTTDFTFTRAAPAVGAGVVVSPIGRGPLGVVGWRASDGTELWRRGTPLSLAVSASPIIDGDRLFVMNVESRLYAMSMPQGGVDWSLRLYGKNVDWWDGPLATPALSRGILVMPTPRDQLYALDQNDGRVLWTRTASPSVLRPLPYSAKASGYLSSPVITDDLVWVAGLDGSLEALQLEDGRLRWTTNLGAPIMSGLAACGDGLVVASFDGTVRFMTHGVAQPSVVARQPGCGGPPGRASGDGGGARGAAGALLILPIGLGLGVWRRRRRRRPAR